MESCGNEISAMRFQVHGQSDGWGGRPLLTTADLSNARNPRGDGWRTGRTGVRPAAALGEIGDALARSGGQDPVAG